MSWVYKQYVRMYTYEYKDIITNTSESEWVYVCMQNQQGKFNSTEMAVMAK